MNKNIGILGGAFNPIHIGHIEIANAVLKNINIDEIWFLVSFNPPHKQLIDIDEFNHRLNMVKIATDNEKRYVVKDLEYKLYNNKIFSVNSTYNVMFYLTKEYPNNNFYIIIGYDELLDIEKWMNYKELLSTYKFIIIKRMDYEVNDEIFDNLTKKYDFKYQLINENIINCSSNNIRNAIKCNNTSKYLDTKVLDYIKTNNLYK